MKMLVAALLAVLVSGCVSQIKTSVTSFHSPEVYETGRTIVVVNADQAQENSLEFRTYKKLFEEQLTLAGFIPIDNYNADLLAIVSYGIDDGTTTTHVGSTPIYGQTGGDYTTYSGTLNSYGSYGSGSSYGTYSGSSYTAPTYGVVGTSTYSYNQTTYKRFVGIDIYQSADLDSPDPTPIYEGRAKSAGDCGNIGYVLPTIVQSMFETFPGENGKSETIIKPSEGSC